MKWVVRIGLGISALVLVVSGLAFHLVDAERVGNVVALQLSNRLGRPIEVREFELGLLPSPNLRMRDVVARAESSESPFVSAEEIRLKLSLLELLVGRVVAYSVDVDSPRLQLELDEEGVPTVSFFVTGGDTSSDDDSTLDALEISSVRIRDGVAQLGPRVFEAVRLDGEVGGLDGRGLAFDFEAELAGVGAIRRGRIETSRPMADPVRWTARLSLVDIDLSELSKCSGRADGRVEGTGRADLVLAGSGLSIDEASAEVALWSLVVQKTGVGGLDIVGDVDLSLELGRGWKADLEMAEVTVHDGVAKPLGIPARMSGPWPAEGAIQSWNQWELLDTRIQFSDFALQGDLRMAGGAPSYRLSGNVDLGQISSWFIGAKASKMPKAGRFAMDDLVYAPPLPLQAYGRIEGAVLPVTETRHASLSGPISIVGHTLASEHLAAVFLEQPLALEGTYDFASDRLDVEISSPARGLDVRRVLETVGQKVTLTGRAYGRVTLAGPVEAARIHGYGSVEILNGELDGANLGDLAAEHRGKPRTTGLIPFQRLSASFDVFDGRLEVSRLVMDQDDATAELAGRIALDSMRLSGEAVFYRDGELTRQGFGVEGTPFAFQGRLIRGVPKGSEEQRRRELAMVEAMYTQMLEMPVPEDPEIAEGFWQRMSKLETRLEALQN